MPEIVTCALLKTQSISFCPTRAPQTHRNEKQMPQPSRNAIEIRKAYQYFYKGALLGKSWILFEVMPLYRAQSDSVENEKPLEMQ